MIIVECIKDTDPFGNFKLPITKGKKYKVEYIEMSSSHTEIYLKGFSQGFNSICFKFFEDDKLIDIYTDPRFNPYLKYQKYK